MPGDSDDGNGGTLDAISSLKDDIRMLMSLAEDDPSYPPHHTGIFFQEIEDIIPEKTRCWLSEATASVLQRFGLGRGEAD